MIKVSIEAIQFMRGGGDEGGGKGGVVVLSSKVKVATSPKATTSAVFLFENMFDGSLLVVLFSET